LSSRLVSSNRLGQWFGKSLLIMLLNAFASWTLMGREGLAIRRGMMPDLRAWRSDGKTGS